MEVSKLADQNMGSFENFGSSASSKKFSADLWADFWICDVDQLRRTRMLEECFARPNFTLVLFSDNELCPHRIVVPSVHTTYVTYLCPMSGRRFVAISLRFSPSPFPRSRKGDVGARGQVDSQTETAMAAALTVS